MMVGFMNGLVNVDFVMNIEMVVIVSKNVLVSSLWGFFRIISNIKNVI